MWSNIYFLLYMYIFSCSIVYIFAVLCIFLQYSDLFFLHIHSQPSLLRSPLSPRPCTDSQRLDPAQGKCTPLPLCPACCWITPGSHCRETLCSSPSDLRGASMSTSERWMKPVSGRGERQGLELHKGEEKHVQRFKNIEIFIFSSLIPR